MRNQRQGKRNEEFRVRAAGRRSREPRSVLLRERRCSEPRNAPEWGRSRQVLCTVSLNAGREGDKKKIV